MRNAHPTQPSPLRQVTPVHSVSLPPRLAGRDVARFTVDAAGGLFVWTPERVDLDYYGPGILRFLHFHFADERVTRLPIPETEMHVPLLVPFVDGRLLLLSPRVDLETRRDNATVYDPAGRPLASFRTGDAVADVQVTATGNIWVSHFDESVRTLDCYSATGEQLFRYGKQPPAGNLPGMLDCYALNVASERDVWVYGYPDFPLLWLRDHQRAGCWDASVVRGSHAFAVDGERVLVAGQYPEYDAEGRLVRGSGKHRLLYLLTLATGVVEALQPVYPADEYMQHRVPIRFKRRQCVGRGGRLYLSDGEDVYVFDLTQL